LLVVRSIWLSFFANESRERRKPHILSYEEQEKLLRAEKSKSMAGIRSVPLSVSCKSELLKWRGLVGPEFSEWVFPAFTNRRHPLQGGRKAWASVLKKGRDCVFPDLQLA
jgi:hypothetical protein